MSDLKQKSIKANFVINIFLSGSAYILPFLTRPYVSRILHADGMGKVSFATSCIAYFTMFAMLGVPTYGIRACARVRDDKKQLEQTVWAIFFMNLLLSVLVYAILGAAMYAIPKLQEQKKLLIIMSSAILLNVIGMDWLYRGLEEYAKLAIRSLVCKLIAVLLIFCFVKKQDDYVLYGAYTVLASYGANIINFFGVKKHIKFTRPAIQTVLRHFKPTLVFFAMSIATTVYTNLDVVMLGFLTDDVQVGYYDATIAIKLILIGVVSSLGAVILPRVSYYIEKGLYQRFLDISKRAFHCILLLAIPIVVFFEAYAEEIIILYSGKGFAGAILPMKILIPTILLIGLTNISGIQMLVPLGKEKIVLYSEICGAAADFAINFLLIPRFGAAGAAIGTLIAETIVLGVQFWALKDVLPAMFQKMDTWKIVLATFAAIMGILWIKKLTISMMSSLLLAGAMFAAVYFILLFVLKETELISLINSVIRKKGGEIG